jgi:peptide/nickel transport system permease protein
MFTYALRRVASMFPLVFVISILVFGLVQLQPGDPLDLLIQGNPDITSADIERLRQAYGLDQPWYVQYGKWAAKAVQGDFGPSRTKNIPAAEFVFEQKLVNTLWLSLAAFSLALLVGIPVGIYAAVRQYSSLDSLATFFAFIGFSTPVFWLGAMMQILFAIQLQWLPASGLQTDGVSPYIETSETFSVSGTVSAIGREGDQTVIKVMVFDPNVNKEVESSVVVPSGSTTSVEVGGFVQQGQAIGKTTTLGSWWPYFLDRLKYLILPAFCLSIIQMATWTRFMRASLLEVINQDYIRTARSKGLGQRTIIYKHALRNAVIPIVTLIGLGLPGLVGGAVLTENVFSWPGMGTALLESIVEKDYNVAMVILMLLAIITLVANLFTDLAYGLVDPRIRYN